MANSLVDYLINKRSTNNKDEEMTFENQDNSTFGSYLTKQPSLLKGG